MINIRPLLISLGTVCLCLSSALADPPSNDRSSRENPTFEAQGTVSAQNIVNWFASNHILSNGIIHTGYNLILRPQDLERNTSNLPNPVSHNLVMHIETRLFTSCALANDSSDTTPLNGDGSCPTVNRNASTGVRDGYRGNQGTALHVLPFEISMSLQVNDPQSASVQTIRAGVVRFVMQTLGITVQLGTYTFENYRHTLGVRHAFSLASVNINEALRLDHNGRFVIVLKGFLDADAGTTISALPALQAARDATNWPGNGSVMRVGGRAQGSVGVRFFDRLLLEFMGGIYSQDSGVDSFTRETGSRTSGITYTTRTGGDRITHRFFGGNLRFQISRNMAITASIVRNFYDLNATYTSSGRYLPAGYYGPGFDPRTGGNPNASIDPSIRPVDLPSVTVDASSRGTTTVQDLSGFIGLEFRY